MAIDYTGTLGIAKLATGENYGTWGVLQNVNWDIVEQAITGNLTVDVTSGDVTLTRVAGSLTSQVDNYAIIVTGTGITEASARKINVPVGTNKAFYIVNNAVAPITVRATAGVGAGSATVRIPNGTAKVVMVVTDLTNTTNVYDQGVGVPGKNYVTNGDMRIDQRNNGSLITISTSGFGVDRFRTSATQSGKLTAQQGYIPNSEYRFALKHTCVNSITLGSSDHFHVNHALSRREVDELDWGSAAAKPITLSFIAASSITGTFGGSILAYNGTSYYSYTFSYTIPIADTPTRISVTISGLTTFWPLDPNKAIFLTWNFGCGSTYTATANTWLAGLAYAPPGSASITGTLGAYLTITNVKMEQGVTATPFIPDDYITSLTKCQHDYEVGEADSMGNGQNGDYHAYTVPFKGTKRLAPTVTVTPITVTNCLANGVANVTANGLRWYCVQSSGYFAWNGSWVADTDH